MQIPVVKLVFLLSFFVAGLNAHADTSGLVFHLDFSHANGLRRLKDTTGHVTAEVHDGSFVVQNGGLRITEGAQVSITADQLPSFSNELTASAWIMKGYFAGAHPIFSRGVHPGPLQFSFSVGGSSPAFVYKNDPALRLWKGITLQGNWRAAIQPYAQPKWQVEGASSEVKVGHWTHLATVFNRGEIKIFVNGVLAVTTTSDQPESLASNDLPLWIGAERLDRQSLNHRTGNMLLNDLRLYQTALSTEEIQVVYESEKPKYPTEPLMAKGVVEMPKCLDYWQAIVPSYDPLFERKLERTKEYEKAVPEDTIGNQHPQPTVQWDHGRPLLKHHGKTEYPVLFMPQLVWNGKFQTHEVLGAVSDFSAADITLLGTGSIDLSFWLGEDRYDWTKVDDICRKIVATNPKSHFAVVFNLRPPPWWFNRHSDEMEIYLDINEKENRTYVGPLGSGKWVKDSTQVVRDLVAHMEASDYANHVFAYIPHGGDAGEWYWPGAFSGGISGYSPATRRSFQQWLRQKYQRDPSRLQQAWGQADLEFEQAKVPLPSDRQASECFLFRDAQQARPSLDFRDYLSDATLANITRTCRAIKESCDRRKLVVVYYGYSLLFAGKGLTLHKSGLLRSREINDSPDIDCIATPLDYVSRRGGETGLNINAFNGTARLSKKLLWHENDLRTHLHPKPVFGRTEDLPESLRVIERGFGLSLTQGSGMWWYMIEGNAMFHDESIMQRIAELKQASSRVLTADATPVAEVALIFDEDSLDRVAANAARLPFMDQHLWGTYQAASRMGAPFDVYLLSDLMNHPEMPKYKLYVFLNAYRTPPRVRKAIHQQLGDRGAVAVWCYAPGCLDDQAEDGFSTRSMKALTGIGLTMQKEETTRTFTITDTSSPITRHGGKFKPYTFGPVFSVDDPKVQVLGEAGGKPSLVVRDLKNWRSVYSLMPLTKELLQGLCDYSDVHVYGRRFDLLTANRSLLMLHTTTGGSQTITLPTPAKVTDALTGALIAKECKQFTVDLPAKATGIYQMQSSQP